MSRDRQMERDREKLRRERTLLQAAQEVKEKKAADGEYDIASALR